MKHRIRAAGILVDDQERVLLALENITPSGTEVWVPPGGGLEAIDRSVVACLQREFAEETGLSVQVGDVLYVREFQEPSSDTHHLELFFAVHSPTGELAHTDRVTAPLGSNTLRCVRWFTREELIDACVEPREPQDVFWSERESGRRTYLGVAGPTP